MGFVATNLDSSDLSVEEGYALAHKTYLDRGRASIMYVGEPPWHGLGTQLKKPATAAEAIKAANLESDVVKKPVVVVDERVALPVPNRFAVVRRDLWGKPECSVLGLVGENYTPLQNREAFQFFDPIVGEKAAIYLTAGALGHGERIWILAKLPNCIRVVGEDVADKYLLLSNSHDGISSVQIKFTPIRVVCQNTLTMALSRGPTVRAIHAKDIHHRLAEARRILGFVERRFELIGEKFRAMVGIRLDVGGLSEYLRLVFPDPEDRENERALKRARLDREWGEYFFSTGKGNGTKGVAGTLWAAYNGIAEYVDYGRSSTLSPDRRLNSVWFGDGYHIKARAFAVAEQKLTAWRN